MFQHSLNCYSTLRVLALVVLWSIFCSPSNAANLFDAGTINQLIKNDQLVLALEKVDQWLDLHPNAVVPLFLKARILTTDGKSDQAVTIYEKLIEVEPDLPEAYNNLGLIYAARGKPEKATRYFQLGLQTDPAYATLYQNLSTLYAVRAISAYRKALLGTEAGESPSDSRTPDLLPLDTLGKR